MDNESYDVSPCIHLPCGLTKAVGLVGFEGNGIAWLLVGHNGLIYWNELVRALLVMSGG